MKNKPEKHEKLIQYIEKLQEQGELTFTKEMALKDLSITENAFLNSSLRLIKKQILIKPFNGFYVIVAPEYRSAGGPPPIWYISDLMKYLGRPYYVGLLSAAALYGATHQAVMELQVVTDRPLKLLKLGKNRIRFVVNKYTKKICKQEVKTPQGPVLVSTPGATATDLVRFASKSGGYSHIATVFIEMGKKIETGDLVKVAEIYKDATLVQRVGYLLEKYVSGIRLTTLHNWLRTQNLNYIRLSGIRTGEPIEKNDKWFVLIDVDIEPDDV